MNTWCSITHSPCPVADCPKSDTGIEYGPADLYIECPVEKAIEEWKQTVQA